MVKDMEVYQFNNIISSYPFSISFIFYHMVSNSSLLFMSISNLILLYNISCPCKGGKKNEIVVKEKKKGIMVNAIKVYQFNNISFPPTLPPFYFLHMFPYCFQ